VVQSVEFCEMFQVRLQALKNKSIVRDRTKVISENFFILKNFI